jgi:hypothetical protein
MNKKSPEKPKDQPVKQPVQEKLDNPKSETPAPDSATRPKEIATKVAKEIGGPKGPEPTRFGDWERKGRCIDF